MRTKKASAKRQSAGERIIKSAKQALAFVKGEPAGRTRLHTFDDLDVKTIRSRTKLSQRQFAQRYGFEWRTLQDWEQGRRIPTGAARTLLRVILLEPEAVERAIARAK